LRVAAPTAGFASPTQFGACHDKLHATAGFQPDATASAAVLILLGVVAYLAL